MTEKIFKSALTLTLGFAVCAYAESYYSEDFSGFSDGYAITNATYWEGGEGDLSKVVEASENKYLELNTEGGTLTNMLSSAAAEAINGALASGTVSFETKVKFVPSDNHPDLSGLEESDAKFAIYALSDENTHTNALVVYHRYYYNEGANVGFVPEVFGNNTVDPEAFTTVRVDMKNTDNGLIFSVALGENGSPLVSQYPYLIDDNGDWVEQYDGNIWMQTVNDANQAAISKLCFQGTGSVDDIAIQDVAVTPTTVNVTVSGGANATAVWTVDGTTVSAPATLTEGQTYSVVYTANQGYKFAQGATTEFSGTVGTTDIAITAPDAIALTVVTVTVTGGANATAVWTVGGETVSAPATLTEGQTYSVVYTANQGYEFAQGATTTFSGTAGTTAIVIAAPNATAIQQADWEANPAEITDGTPAATQYPELASSALATADAKKLTIWAQANNIDFAAVEADTTGAYVDAFLLNCTQAQVEAEAAAFVLNITFNNGVPVVSTPDGKTYNVTPVLKGKAALTDTEWTTINDTDENDANDTADFNFFKAELSL